MAERMWELKNKIRTPLSDRLENVFRDNLNDLRVLVAKEYCIMLIGTYIVDSSFKYILTVDGDRNHCKENKREIFKKICKVLPGLREPFQRDTAYLAAVAPEETGVIFSQ